MWRTHNLTHKRFFRDNDDIYSKVEVYNCLLSAYQLTLYYHRKIWYVLGFQFLAALTNKNTSEKWIINNVLKSIHFGNEFFSADFGSEDLVVFSSFLQNVMEHASEKTNSYVTRIPQISGMNSFLNPQVQFFIFLF